MPINNLTEEGFGILTGSAASGNDADAQAFIDAAGITGETQQAALNQLVLDLKGTGSTTNNTDVWSDIYAVYPFTPIDNVTANSSCYKWNLKDPRDLDAAFRLTFINTPVFSIANGLEQNATANAYANSHFVESANMVAGNNGLTISTNNEPNYPNDYSIGDRTIFSIRKGTVRNFFYSASQLVLAAVSNKNGIKTLSRRSAIDMEGYFNGISEGTNTTSSTTQSNASVFILGVNNGAGAPADYCEGNIDFSVIHKGLTTAQVVDLVDAINIYKTALGR